jgi:hypothetical protein
LFETSGCPRGVGWACAATAAPRIVTLKKITFAFTMLILADQNYGESRKLRLVVNPISV